jgi:hypothetical protein
MIKYHVNINKFSKIDSEESAYWLGFLYADGCMSEESRIGVMLKASDKHHLEKLKNFLEWDKEVKIRQNGKYAKEISHQMYDNANIYLDRKFEIATNMPF